MDLSIKNIIISKKERKVTVNLDFQQWATFQPFGDVFITNTSENILKKNIRFIGELTNKLPYFRKHQKELIPSLEEIEQAEKELSKYVSFKLNL